MEKDSEIKILRKLVQLEGEEYELQAKENGILSSNNEEKITNFQKDKEKIAHKIDELKSKLEHVEDNSYSSNAQNYMRNQLQNYILEINKPEHIGQKLLARQNLILENTLISDIIHNINRFLMDEAMLVEIPAYLIYTKNEVGIIEIPKLSVFLQDSLKKLNEIQNVNYIKLRKFFEEFKTLIIEKFGDNLLKK